MPSVHLNAQIYSRWETGIILYFLPMQTVIRPYIGKAASVGVAIHVDESFAVGYYINIDFARSRMEFKSGVRMTERGGQMFPYEVELERPLSSKTGECFHVDVIVSGTILEVYVDNRIALGTRMFDITGGNFGLYASDAEANFMNIQIFKKKI